MMRWPLVIAVILSVVAVARGQSVLHPIANTITGAATSLASNEWVPGIKNILGGIQVNSILKDSPMNLDPWGLKPIPFTHPVTFNAASA